MSERADLDRAGYVPGYGTAAGQYMAVRTAFNSADFFLPHLRPGMNVLDCGCGSGTITIGLAEAVSPGEVVGVDHEPVQVEQARALAAERGVDGVRFETADLFALPFADGTFDAAFAHAVLMHVGDPRGRSAGDEPSGAPGRRRGDQGLARRRSNHGTLHATVA